MEKIIFIIVAIVISLLWKAATKSLAKKEATGSGVPPRSETTPDAIPMPEDWGKMFTPKDIFNPVTVKPSAEKQSQKPKKSFRETIESKQSESSQFGTLGDNNRAGAAPGSIPTAPSHHEEHPVAESEFAIHSAEDARRAIIWGEILQRKY